MPQKLSEVGRLYAQLRAAAGAATPAEAILSGRGYQTSLTPEQIEALRPHPGPPPPPEAAGPEAIEALRQELREAVFAVSSETDRLNALHRGRERAYAERHVAAVAVAEAEAALKEAKKTGRQHLALAYVNQEVLTGPTPANSQAELDLRRDQHAQAAEVEHALAEDISRTEFDLAEHRRRRDAALSALVCASPQTIGLYQRQGALWIELRSLRLCMRAIGDAMGGSGLSQELLSLSQASENVSDRRTGFEVDEGLIDTWVSAVRALAENADALLPGQTYKIDRDDTNGGNPPASPVRGGHPSPPRPRAQGAVVAPRRPARLRSGRPASAIPVDAPAGRPVTRRRWCANVIRSPASGGQQKKRRSQLRRRGKRRNNTVTRIRCQEAPNTRTR